MSVQPLPKTITIFCTREENFVGGNPTETVKYKAYGVEKEYEGQFHEYGFVEYIAGVIGAEIGFLDPPWHTMVAQGIAAIDYAIWKLADRGYISDMSGYHQAFTTMHITPARMEAAAEAVKWRIMDPEGNSAKGMEYCANSGGYTVAGDYPWLIAQYDKWTDYYNGCPLDIKNHPEYAQGFRSGNGRGLSQVGALRAANDGKTFKEILEFYYPGTKVVRVMPFIYQSDSRIAGINYLSDEDSETSLKFSQAGCGPAALKMCEHSLKGGYDEDTLYDEISEIANFSLKNGCKGEGGTRIEKLCRLWCPPRGMDYISVETLDDVKAYSAANDGVSILNVDKTNGLFSTSGGHYVAAIHIEGWGWWIHNPGKIGHDNENRFYTDEEVQSAFKGLAIIIWEGESMSNKILFAEGYRGPEATKIENRLNELGFEVIGNDGKDYTDDYYGTVTTRKVKALQEKMKAEGVPNVAVTGAVDDVTWNYMFPPEPEEPGGEEPPEAVDYEWLKEKLAAARTILDEIEEAFDL